MAVRTALLTSRNINLDTDFSKYIESVTDAGIISGFEVTASSVAAGTAWVPCTRTNLETIYALVQNFSAVSISGNGHVIIKVDDTIVDNGGGNEDGTGIATIEVVANLPSKNYLELATISNGTVTMVAPTIKKLNELNTEIQSIFSQLADLDERVEHLEEADAIDHLEESGLVWELYTLEDTLFKQYASTLANSTLEANVGDVAANTEIHIQAMGSGVASNQLKLKVKMAWAPTTSLVCEVRKGIQVTVTENVEAYWYGDSNNIIATGTLASSSFSNDWAEVTFNLDNEVGGTKWELLDVVVYQTTGSGATVNASNYYVVACDSTQYSEAFSYVSVNGSTRARSKLMPYLSSDGFVQAMLCKTKPERKDIVGSKVDAGNTNSTSYTTLYSVPITTAWFYNIDFDAKGGSANNCYIGYTTDSSSSSVTKAIVISDLDDFVHFSEKNIYIEAGKTLYIKGKVNVTSQRIYYKNIYITKSYPNFEKSKGINWIPKTINIIGTQWIIIIYGLNKDGYYGGIITWTSEEAYTGAIAPWNFVGYLEVNYNGSIVKVPYYN